MTSSAVWAINPSCSIPTAQADFISGYSSGGFWPARAARSFGLWMVRDWADHRLLRKPEVFPKQNYLTGKMLGNWVRLPGKHHTRNHWSRGWTGDRWGYSPLLLFNRVGNDFQLPEEALIYSGKDDGGKVDRDNLKLPQGVPYGTPRRISRTSPSPSPSRDALAHYKNKDLDYDQWFKVAASLTERAGEWMAGLVVRLVSHQL